MKHSLNNPDERAQDRHKSRRDKFWQQTVAQNSHRLDTKVDSFSELHREVKFIQSVLLTRLRDDN